MEVISTRGGGEKLRGLKAVLKGIAPDGGLFVPVSFPEINWQHILKAVEKGYDAAAAEILELFFEDLTISELSGLAKLAYASFNTPEVAPLVPLKDHEHILELTHGPTLAFKDMALQVLPRLISSGLTVLGYTDDILILTATSGDTGKAALEGFKNVPRTSICVFYPADGVSSMQRLQMVTQEGRNVGVFGVKGNFDDTQTGVKTLFADKAFNSEAAADGYSLSSANSINIGRLAPQVAYYIITYARLVLDERIKLGDKINFCVPTGNFGNILAAYYAHKMGMPIGKLICASNHNNVLTDFFKNGTYDANRPFHKTISPSMDILISSNLERLLFELSGRDAKSICEWMKSLSENGSYTLNYDEMKEADELFYAGFADEDQTRDTIRSVFEKTGYLMDPHTAVAQCVYENYIKETSDDTLTVTVSTANPYKFTTDVFKALTGVEIGDAFEAAVELSAITKTEVPPQIRDLREKPILHKSVIEIEKMGESVSDFLGRL